MSDPYSKYGMLFVVSLLNRMANMSAAVSRRLSLVVTLGKGTCLGKHSAVSASINTAVDGI